VVAAVDDVREQHVAIEGTDLFVRDVGSGPAIVFVHGMCGDADAWLDQQARLCGRYRCLAYDRRGHSRSPFGNGVRTVQAHADDLAALVDAMGLAPILLVGSSGGARIGLDVARRYPQVLAGAVLSEPALIPLSDDGGASFVAELAPAIRAALTPQAAVDAFFEVVDPRLWAALPEERKDRFRANHVELFGDLEMPPYAPTDAELAAISVRIRFLVGADTKPVFGQIVRRVAPLVPVSDVVELPGATHATYATAPGAFADEVASFAAAVG